VAAGRNPAVLEKLAKRGTGIISLDQDDAALADAFAAAAGERGFDVVADYLWGRPTEILLGALDRHDAEIRSGRTRLVQAGEMAGSQITLPASVLRSAGLEILGMGTGTMSPMEPPMEQITAMLTDLLDGGWPAARSPWTASGCRWLT